MSFIYAERPHRVYWEITRACDLACRHCRAEAVPHASPRELTHEEGLQLLAQLAEFGAPLPHLVLTGGDALKRKDLFELIDAARALGFSVSVAPSATPLLTADALHRLHDAGVDAISLSLDGATAARHDAIRGIVGTYERTLAAARAARNCGLPFQVNTLVCEETVDDLPAIYEQVVAMGASRWSLFFLVTVGRGEVLAPVSPARAEALLEWVATIGGRPGSGKPIVTTTEAPHLRRITSQRHRGPSSHGAGIRDGNGIMFISHVGDICPSGFLEIATGNVREISPVDVYRSSQLFRLLRAPEGFADRCGRCEFHFVCGGSRARAYASSGDPLGQDPLCLHEPASERAAPAVDA
jgi:MoaA/NifB/PqqE/SkfB family radical SAM enzyme